MGAGTSPADPSASTDGTAATPSRADAPGTGERTADGAAPDQAATRDGDARDDAASPGGAAREGAGDGDGGTGTGPRPSRRFPSLTRDTARPEGGGRAASGDAPAPARQWPLLAVLCTAGIGLLIVAVDPFAEAFRVGTILIGAALIGGAVLRLVVPSVGMLAVRSRFTDLVTYGLLGFLIVMLALVAQPKPWLDIPFLEQAVHFTIR
ncbi:DUF3017 domain-containing protein [Streptomyces sp. NPDC004728]|uniref:DUF3017 domain-containing protein n=1 Tax=Streptomyces sp. NPDC004728 TaxID=3154289 RepID=UPI0033B39A46